MSKKWIENLNLEEKAYEILSRPNWDGVTHQEPFLSSAANVVSRYLEWIIERIDDNSMYLESSELTKLAISLIDQVRKANLDSYNRGVHSKAYCINIFHYLHELTKETEAWHPYIKITSDAFDIIIEDFFNKRNK